VSCLTELGKISELNPHYMLSVAPELLSAQYVLTVNHSQARNGVILTLQPLVSAVGSTTKVSTFC
jgi:hypothetical protein